MPNPELQIRILVRASVRRDRNRNSFGKWSIPYPLEVVLFTVKSVGNSMQLTLSANHLQGIVPGARDTETNTSELLLSGNLDQRGRQRCQQIIIME